MTLIEEGFGRIAEFVDAMIPMTPNRSVARSSVIFSLSLSVFWMTYRASSVKWNWFTSTIAMATSAMVSVLPAEDFRSLVIDGVVGGVGGVLVFLPQICILFFFIALLEDSGYMGGRPL